MNNRFYKSLNLIFLLAVICIVTCPLVGRAQTLNFNDNNADTMFAGSQYYELALSKSDGHICYIKDKSANKIISLGDENSSLWRAVYLNGGDTYSASFVGGQKNRFNYSWYSAGDSLVLNYIPDQNSAENISVKATFVFSAGHHFDLTMTLTNNTADSIENFNCPRNLMFDVSEMQSAYIPVIPGIKLKQGFFTEHRNWNNGNYPGSLNFADYIQLETSNGNFSLYHILNEDFTPMVIRRLSFLHDNDINKDIYILVHSFQLVLPPGKSWMTPTIRIRIGQDVYTTAQDHRNEYGINNMPSLRTKLGSDYLKTVSALSTKIDVGGLYSNSQITISKYKYYLQKMPSPCLLYVVGWPLGGYDKVAPDLFPPDPRFGTNQDLTNLTIDAQKLGDIMNPYINPTYWNKNAPTFNTLNVNEVSVLDHNRVPDYESYCSTCLGGYGISPFDNSVINRLQQEIDEARKYLNSKTLWVDQIGSRAGEDFNPSEPRVYGQAQGWLDYARKYKSMNIIDEFGYDRMVSPLLGFQGSLDEFLVAGDQEIGDGAWGAGNWEYFPLIPFIARDKILLYNSSDNYCVSKDTLTRSFSLGYSLSYNDPFYHLDDDWLWTDASFQKNALALFADERVSSYTHNSDSVTTTNFQNYSVLGNWSRVNTLTSNNDVISTRGFELTGDNGNVKAGVFTKINGHDLSTGDHFIIQHRYPDSIVVNYPQGNDTKFWMAVPSGWTASNIKVYAISRNSVYPRTDSVLNNEFGIDLKVKINNDRIDRYVITNGGIYLTTPDLLQPSTNQLVNTYKPEIKWSKVSFASGYELQISEDDNFDKVLFDYQSISDTGFTADSLSAGTSFFTRVRAVNATQTGPWSIAVRFRIEGINPEDGLVAYYPLDNSPEDLGPFENDGSVINGVQPAVDRNNKADGAYSFNGTDGYIEIPESTSLNSIEHGITVAAWVNPKTYKSEMGVADHDRYWMFLLSDGHVTGDIFDENSNENRLLSTPQVPLNSWSYIAFTYDDSYIRVYVNGSLTDSLSFPASRIGDGTTSTTVRIGHGIGNSQNFFDGSLDDLVIYNRALTGTEIQNIFTNGIFVSPVLKFPEDKQTVFSDTTSIKWSVVPGAVSYEVQLSVDRNFTGISTLDSTITDTTLLVKNLLPDTTYYWRLRSVNNNGNSGWSLFNSFGTSMLTGIKRNDQIPKTYQLSQNYPNPFNPSTNIEFRIPKNERVSLKIYDVIGREVKTLVDKQLSAGNYKVNWNAGDMASGVYFYRIVAGNFIQTKKLILLK